MSKGVKLHLGCGGIRIPGYVNVDIQKSEAVDVTADLKALPFDAGSADVIYASPVLEHFGRNEWVDLIRYWSGFLMPDGIMRLSVPDFQAVIAQYAEQQNLEELLGLIIGGQKDDYDWHGMIFDFQTLRDGMASIGLVDIARYDWRKTEPGSLGIDDFSQAYLPHMAKDSGRLMMLNVEGRKP